MRPAIFAVMKPLKSAPKGSEWDEIMGLDLKEILPPTIEELISVLEFSTEYLSDDALDTAEDCRNYFEALGCLDRDMNDYETIDTYCALEKISDFYNTQSYDDILSELLEVWESRCGW